jgi:hypothetical protein
MMEPIMVGAVGIWERTIAAVGPLIQADEVLQFTIAEISNLLLDAEEGHLSGTRNYERTVEREDTRAAAKTGSCIPGPAKWH